LLFTYLNFIFNVGAMYTDLYVSVIVFV